MEEYIESDLSETEEMQLMQNDSLFIQILPQEIQLNILEFVLGINPKLIEAEDIFEALDQAKLIVQENGNRFASICTWFSNFKKEEFPKIIRKNLKNYLALNWGKEYLGKDIKELNQLLENIFTGDISKERLAIAVKLICAGANLKTILNRSDLKQLLFLCIGIDCFHPGEGLGEKLMLVLFLYEIDVNDVHDENDYGKTALTKASSFNNITLVKLLLTRKNIELNKLDNRGYTALDYAQAYGYREITDLLLNAKAIENNKKVDGLKNWIWREKEQYDKWEEMVVAGSDYVSLKPLF